MVVCFPFSLAPYVYRPWIYGDILCKITPFLQGTSVGVSVFTLLAISIDRFFAIYQPLKSRLLFSRKRVKWLLCCVWIVSMLVSLPMLFVNNVKVEVLGIATCRETWIAAGSKQSYNVFVFLVLYVIPVMFMSIAYTRIGMTLWSTDSAIDRRSCKGDFNKRNGSFTNKITRERRKIVRMLIMVAVMFAVSWLPYHVVTLYLDFNPNGIKIGMLAMYVYPMVQWFSLSNSAINPVCYCLLSKRFQAAFMSCCKRLCCFGCYDTTHNRTRSGRLQRTRYNRRTWTSMFKGSRCETTKRRPQEESVVFINNKVQCPPKTIINPNQSFSKLCNTILQVNHNTPSGLVGVHGCAYRPCSINATRISENEDSSSNCPKVYKSWPARTPNVFIEHHRDRSQSQTEKYYIPIKCIRHVKSSVAISDSQHCNCVSHDHDQISTINQDTDSLSVCDLDSDINTDDGDGDLNFEIILNENKNKISSRKLSDAITYAASDLAHGLQIPRSTSCTLELQDRAEVRLSTENDIEQCQELQYETVL